MWEICEGFSHVVLSLPRKQTPSSASPEEGAGSPSGGAATFPFVVLPGGEPEPGKRSGLECFDAFARRTTPSGLSPRQALVQALAGNESPWDAPVVAAPATTRRMSISASEEVRATPAPEQAPAPEPASKPERAPAPAKLKAKLRIATRASMPPFPMPTSVPESVDEAVRPELASMPPLAPVPSWREPGMASPMLPIPGLSSVPAAAPAAPRADSFAGSRPPWPAPPGSAVRVPAPLGAPLPVHEQPSRRFLRPVVAAVVALAVVIGAGEWWRRNQRAKADERAAAVARAATPPPPPVVVEPAAKEPSEAFRAWGRNARISGVLERENGRVRALINGRLAMDGDLVDAALELRLMGQDKAARRLIFEERGGARLEVDY